MTVLERARIVRGVVSGEPVTRQDVKDHLRVTHDREDQLIDRQITASREWLEGFTGRAFVSSAAVGWLDALPSGDVVLPIAPVIAISAIEVFSAAGVATLIGASSYALDQDGRDLPIVRWVSSVAWPSDVRRWSAVRITSSVGYGATADTVPARVRAAVLLLVGALYENREASVERVPAEPRLSAERLVWDLRLFPGGL